MVPPSTTNCLAPQTRENGFGCFKGKRDVPSAPTPNRNLPHWGGVMLTGLFAVASASGSVSKMLVHRGCSSIIQIGTRLWRRFIMRFTHGLRTGQRAAFVRLLARLREMGPTKAQRRLRFVFSPRFH